MQPHEGPRRDRDGEEQQRRLTWRLSLAILVLAGVLAAVLLGRT